MSDINSLKARFQKPSPPDPKKKPTSPPPKATKGSPKVNQLAKNLNTKLPKTPPLKHADGGATHSYAVGSIRPKPPPKSRSFESAATTSVSGEGVAVLANVLQGSAKKGISAKPTSLKPVSPSAVRRSHTTASKMSPTHPRTPEKTQSMILSKSPHASPPLNRSPEKSQSVIATKPRSSSDVSAVPNSCSFDESFERPFRRSSPVVSPKASPSLIRSRKRSSLSKSYEDALDFPVEISSPFLGRAEQPHNLREVHTSPSRTSESVETQKTKDGEENDSQKQHLTLAEKKSNSLPRTLSPKPHKVAPNLGASPTKKSNSYIEIAKPQVKTKPRPPPNKPKFDPRSKPAPPPKPSLAKLHNHKRLSKVQVSSRESTPSREISRECSPVGDNVTSALNDADKDSRSGTAKLESIQPKYPIPVPGIGLKRSKDPVSVPKLESKRSKDPIPVPEFKSSVHETDRPEMVIVKSEMAKSSEIEQTLVPDSPLHRGTLTEGDIEQTLTANKTEFDSASGEWLMVGKVRNIVRIKSDSESSSGSPPVLTKFDHGNRPPKRVPPPTPPKIRSPDPKGSPGKSPDLSITPSASPDLTPPPSHLLSKSPDTDSDATIVTLPKPQDSVGSSSRGNVDSGFISEAPEDLAQLAREGSVEGGGGGGGGGEGGEGVGGESGGGRVEEEVVEVWDEERLEKARKKRLNIAKELLETEKTYVDRLAMIAVRFSQAVEQFNLKSRHLIPESDLQQIFLNIKQIHQLNVNILQDLQDCMDDWDSHEGLGDVICRLAPFLKLYTTYTAGFEDAMKLLTEWTEKSKKFDSLVREFEREAATGLGVAHYMLEPVQRIPRYRLLLADYLKYLPQDSPDRPSTEKALGIISEAANRVNNRIKELEHSNEVLSIQRSLQDYDGDTLLSPSRVFIKKGTLLKFSRKTHSPRCFFLFSDVLLHTQPSGTDLYRFRNSMPIYGMKVEEPKVSLMPFSFNVYSTTRALIVVAKSEEDKQEWMECLQKAIHEDSMKRKSLRKDLIVQSVEQSGFALKAPIMVPDKSVTMCQTCSAEFTFTFRRHHCRACGKVMCGTCSQWKAYLPYMEKSERVCESCFSMARLGEGESVDLDSPKLPKKQESIPSSGGVLNLKAYEDDAVIAGYVLSLEGKRWLRLWYQVKADCVLYKFKAHEDIKAIHSMPLPGYIVSPDTGNAVVNLIHPSSKKQLCDSFKVEEPTAFSQWVAVLNKVVRMEVPTATAPSPVSSFDESGEHPSSRPASLSGGRAGGSRPSSLLDGGSRPSSIREGTPESGKASLDVSND